MNTTDRHQAKRQEQAMLASHSSAPSNSYVKALALVAVVAVLGGGVVWWITASAASHRESAWNAYFQATDRATFEDALSDQAFESVSSQFPNTLAAAWTQLNLADERLEDGLAAYQRRSWADGQQQIRTAIEHYTTAEKILADQPGALRDRAKVGLATALESLGRKEDLNRARELYLELNRPDCLYEDWAKQRIDSLDEPSTNEFYDFLVAELSKPETPAVIPGEDGQVPFDLELSPNMFGPGSGSNTPAPGPTIPDPNATTPEPTLGTGEPAAETETPAEPATPAEPMTDPVSEAEPAPETSPATETPTPSDPPASDSTPDE